MATPTFFFYDLETSGLEPKQHRIMQFAGRRTDLALEPIGEPVEFFVRLSPEVLPTPQAIATTGISPQYALEHGILEREAIERIMNECFTPDTIVVGFNNVRFDDEFIRYSAYRNFWNPYEWAYADGRSRWDLLDGVRLVRALRPDGIIWPVDDDGGPINRLELITQANGVEHLKAHDAMSDVNALIEVARLIRTHQPKMFDYLLGIRSKQAIAKLVDPKAPQIFVYASGRYGKEHDFTTAAVAVGNSDNGKVIIWDLRYDPNEFLGMDTGELSLRLFSKRSELEALNLTRLPVKELAGNKCPAVAPWSTVRPQDTARLGLDPSMIETNLKTLLASDLPLKLIKVYRERAPFESSDPYDVDAALYDGFIDAQSDKNTMTTIRRTPIDELSQLKPTFTDKRLAPLWLRYLGRNDPDQLSELDRQTWKEYVIERRQADEPTFLESLDIITDPKMKQLLLDWSTQDV